MLQTLNKYLQKLMPIITPTGVLIGIIFSEWLHHLVFLVSWIFAFMTLSGSLSSNFSDFKSIRRYTVPLLVCLFILHLFMPFLAYSVGNLLYPNDPYTLTGLVLAFIIPTGISSLIWVSIYKGSVVFTLLIILLDTMLAPFLVPSLLHLFVGATVEINGFEIMKGLIWMIVLPSIIGMSLNQITKGTVKKNLAPTLAPFTKLGLGAVVAINSSAIAPYFKEMNSKLVFMIIVVFSIALFGYIISWVFSKILKMDRDTVVALTFNGGMRNITAGAVIAITYFPAPVALPVIIGMLFQQIIASVTGNFLSRYEPEKIRLHN